jgi:MFS family permease
MAETQPTDPRPSDTPTERTSLLGSSNAGAAQPVAPVTRQSRLGLPKYLLFPVLIFLLGSGVDYYDGSIFSTGFGSIGALYKQQNHAAWLTIVYTTIFAVAQPLYSIASRCINWTILLSIAFLVFALGQWIASLTEPPDPKRAPPETRFVILVPLLFARAVTAVGACAMVYVPNLVFNGTSNLVAKHLTDCQQWLSLQGIGQYGKLSRHFLSSWLNFSVGE